MLKYFEILLIILVIVATVMIFSFSASDATDSSAQSKIVSNGIVDVFEKVTNKTIGEISGKNEILMRGKVRKVVRKIAHFAEFMLFGFITFLATFFARHERKCLITLGIGIITASADELIQLFSVGRKGLISDVIIDTFGVATGIVLGILILKSIRNLYKTEQ